MLRWRLTSLAITLGLLMGGGAALRAAGGATGPFPGMVAAASRGPVPSVLELFYTPPVMVRAGEAVRIPVDVVCALPSGRACRARATFGARVDGERAWRVTTVVAEKGMRLDLSALAARAAERTGSVAFWLRARWGARSVSLGSPDAPLRFHVVDRLPVVWVPAVAFGHVRPGRTVLSLPWGSGAGAAGLRPGNESPTLGPSAFDVDAERRVFLADGLRDRLAVFRAGHLVREVPMTLGPRADLAVDGSGRAFVVDSVGGRLSVRSVGPQGPVRAVGSAGPGVIGGIHVVGGRAYANVLPADQWMGIGSSGPATAAPVTGMPTAADGELLRIGTDRTVRLGLLHRGRVIGPVELRSGVRFGEVALAASTGRLGYALVVRTWRGGAHPADQYQVVVLRAGRVAETFGIADRAFANTPPLSRFRLGADGALYQLRSTASGMSVVRFGLGGAR